MVKREPVLSQRKLEIVTKSRRALIHYRIYTAFEISRLAIIKPGQQNVVSCEKSVIS
jgi:hypothetical protein